MKLKHLTFYGCWKWLCDSHFSWIKLFCLCSVGANAVPACIWELGEAKASHLLWMLGNGYVTVIFHGSSYSACVGANAVPASLSKSSITFFYSFRTCKIATLECWTCQQFISVIQLLMTVHMLYMECW